METTVVSFKTMAPEAATSAKPSIMIESNLGSRHNPAFESLTMRWVTKPKVTGVLGAILGGGQPEQRTCVQSFNVDVIQKLGLKPGVNLNEVFEKNGLPIARIAISEIVQSEYDNLEQADQLGYQAKVNPSTGELLGKNGEQIYRKVYFTDLDVADEYVISDQKPVKNAVKSEVEADDEIPA